MPPENRLSGYVSVTRSSLMPLAVHASTRLFDDRFETYTPLFVPSLVGDDGDAQEQQAALKLRAAMQTLDLRRLEAQRASQKKERLGLKFAIVFVTCVIAAATVYFATRKPAVLSPWGDLPQARKRLRRAPPPQPVKSVPLFTPEDRP